MPTPLMEKWAKQYNVPIATIERYWLAAKKAAGKKFKHGTAPYWAYVTGTVKKILGNR